MRGFAAVCAVLALGCGGDDHVSRVFVTASKYDGNLGGVGGGDAACASAAEASGRLKGSHWIAWLSDAQNNAIDRLQDAGPWYRPDGTTKVFEDKAHVAMSPAMLLAPIGVDELGTASTAFVWTGTLSRGLRGTSTCADWWSNDALTMFAS